MAKKHVPQFGKWEGEQNVPYTVVFDKARQDRGGKMPNPYESYDNPAPAPAPAPAALGSRGHSARPQTEKNEPVRAAPTHERRASREIPDRRRDGLGEGNRGSSRATIGPTNPHGTPSRSTRSNALDDNLDKGATLPAFGQWDVANPAAGAAYTAIFKEVSYEKHNGSPIITTETHDYSRPKNNNAQQKAKSSCFPWW